MLENKKNTHSKIYEEKCEYRNMQQMLKINKFAAYFIFFKINKKVKNMNFIKILSKPNFFIKNEFANKN